MGVLNYQLTTNFSANCQFTTIFLANCPVASDRFDPLAKTNFSLARCRHLFLSDQ